MFFCRPVGIHYIYYALSTVFSGTVAYADLIDTTVWFLGKIEQLKYFGYVWLKTNLFSDVWQLEVCKVAHSYIAGGVCWVRGEGWCRRENIAQKCVLQNLHVKVVSVPQHKRQHADCECSEERERAQSDSTWTVYLAAGRPKSVQLLLTFTFSYASSTSRSFQGNTLGFVAQWKALS